MAHPQPTLEIRIPIEGEDERAALQQALLRARSTELAEVRRLEIRLTAGYGDESTRASMTGEADRARLRWTMIDRLLDGFQATIGGRST